MDDLDRRLWNDDIGPTAYANLGEKYQNAVLDQYKTYVEMADRISARRSLTNTFFLTLNSAVVTALATLAGPAWHDVAAPLLAAGLVILLTQCLTWFFTVRSYRQLNSAKYTVIGALEKRLPALTYSEGEWLALGEGRDWRRYLPLTQVEQSVPLIFAASYVLGFLALLL
ncbi:hypothetical protein [Nocardiopsis sp. FIRDI 009]|uniref:RipA family octameric membrane protein n=1 Tax=Nocardiopsis sp. FIRDI 009 TaxID=714197 RepID=UPI000E2566CC|nr:hypothetical protein [Nocardiopsis sp. FIRDI 009]